MGRPCKGFDPGFPSHHRPAPHLLNPAQPAEEAWYRYAGKTSESGIPSGTRRRLPGGHDTTDLPRKADEIQRASVSYKSQSCHVTSDGARVSVTFDGLNLGLFSGDLEFTAYKGSNLLRQEAIAKTDQPSVAYIYKAGLKGFAIDNNTKLVWRDTARQCQQYAFGGAPNKEPINLRARNRLEILDTGHGSLAVFPPPHKFFFARENEINLGYVYYRKDDDKNFSLGVMQPERGEGYVPWGVTDAIWNRRTAASREEWDNFAVYNAPPGTLQHMPVYYYRVRETIAPHSKRFSPTRTTTRSNQCPASKWSQATFTWITTRCFATATL